MIELQYIRKIRSFLLVSNLGCRGVNRGCTRDTRKGTLRLAEWLRKLGKQALDQNGKRRVNEDDEEIRGGVWLFGPRSITGSRIRTGEMRCKK